MKKRWMLLPIAMLAISSCAAVGSASEWLTGTALQRYLSEPIDLLWPENPLGDSLARFSHVHQIAILLDRRIDPDLKISLTLKQSPFGESLAAIAMRGELGVTLTGSVAYFGPVESAAKLRTLIFLREEEAKKMPSMAGKKFLQAKPFVWKNYSQPRETLERLSRENHFAIIGLDAIPYDLWAAADLPAMTLVERLSLIAIQYDLTFAIAADGKQITLAPVPSDIRLTRSYPAGKNSEETAHKYAELAPNAEIKVAGDKLVVKGMLEVHERITAPHRPAGQNSTKDAPADLTLKRFTLTITEQPIGPLLKKLSKQLDLQLQMDENKIESSGVSLDQRVSFQVEDATIDQLLQAAIEESPLKYRRQDRVLVIESMKEGRGERDQGRE
jgi:hypothetical protein